MALTIDARVRDRFPELDIRISSLKGVKVERSYLELESFKEEVFKEISENYNLETLKDVDIFRAYRDFFWRAGIDPTKTRPAAEALIRRVLAGRPIPKINSLVDAYNLASIKTGIALAAFDEDELKGDLTARFAEPGEEFLGIGMTEPVKLKGGEIVIADEEKLIAIYPYRDSEQTMITDSTRNVLLMICGVPNVDQETLHRAEDTAVEYIVRFCGGRRQQ
ncbi:MAG: B3/4 domain-containing protein [Nitrososphaerales archaeon]